MRPLRILALLLLAWAGWTHAAPAHAASPAGGDLDAARKLFERNLDAIRLRDLGAYLACYLDSERMARSGPEGFRLGYKEHAKESAAEPWPDRFEGLDLRLVPVSPGVVYGTYRYRVSYGEEEHAGLSERIFLKTTRGWKIAMTSAFDAPPGTPPPPRALLGATLVDGTGAPPVPDSVVVLRAGKIDCAGTRQACPVPEGVEATDLRGAWIAPGLVDAHVHFSQTGWADGRPDALDVRDRHPYEQVQAELRARPERWLRSYLCSGVTAVFDVGGYPWTWGLRGRAETDARAPRVAAAGPLLSTVDFWLNLPAERQFIYLADEKAARDGVRYLAANRSSAVKVWFILDEKRPFEEMSAALLAAGDEARKAGLPLIVHATELRAAKVALRAGAKLLVHSVWDGPVDEEFLSLARQGGAIYCPTLIVPDGYLSLAGSVLSGKAPAVDDPRGCADPEILERVASTSNVGAERADRARSDKRSDAADERRRIGAENLRRVAAAGIPIATGTDAGNPLTLHGVSIFAEMEAMEAAGLTPMQVLTASTRGGAMAMGREKEIGTVEAGKLADLLVLDADPAAGAANLRRIRTIIRGGVVRSADELRVRR